MSNLSTQSKPFGYVPPGISFEAKAYLESATPIGDGILEKTLEDFQLMRGFYKQFTLEVSEKYKTEYVDFVEKAKIGDVSVMVVTPKNCDPLTNKIMVYIHGGAFTLGSSEHLFQIFAPVAYQAKMKVFAIDYRLAPEFPFPCGLEDCFTVYENLLESYDPKNVFFLGDSAGGSLCISTIFKAREQGLPLPAAVGLYSPAVDLEKKGDTLFTLEGRSPKLSYEKSLEPNCVAYAPREKWSDPYISVINGYFSDFPPTTVHTGTRDALLSDSVRLHRAIEDVGGICNLQAWEGMWHDFQELDMLESKQSSKKIAEFFNYAPKMVEIFKAYACK